MATKKHQSSIWKAILLVAGTSIGGGMLAMPVLTAQAGFVPSLAVYAVCWIFMACTGLLFLEIGAWLHREANIVSMASQTLGKAGKFCAWALYLFLFYCLTLAYVVGGGNFFADVLLIPSWLGAFVFTILFGSIVYMGPKWVGRINAWMVLALGAAYATFVVLGLPYVQLARLQTSDWSWSPSALPIAFAAFAYQGSVPTLAHYLNYDIKKTRIAILAGSFITVITYSIWQGLILGIVPLETLIETLSQGQSAVHPLRQLIGNPTVYFVGQFFAFFALTTSFLGVTLGLSDFLADGLKIKKTARGRLLLCALVFIPPLILADLHPTVFLQALKFAGGYGCALLLGVLPILMVWIGRYRRKIEGKRVLPGGRVVLSLLLLFVFFELFVEIRRAFVS